MFILNVSDIRYDLKDELDEKTFKIYLEKIEPRIHSLVENYFRDWQYVEAIVTAMVMNESGLLQTKLGYCDVDKEDVRDYDAIPLAIEQLEKLKKMSIKNKIEYLRAKNTIGKDLYEALHAFRAKRNLIHRLSGVITESDRRGFAGLHAILAPLLGARAGKMDKVTADDIIHTSDRGAISIHHYYCDIAKSKTYPAIAYSHDNIIEDDDDV